MAPALAVIAPQQRGGLRPVQHIITITIRYSSGANIVDELTFVWAAPWSASFSCFAAPGISMVVRLQPRYPLQGPPNTAHVPNRRKQVAEPWPCAIGGPGAKGCEADPHEFDLDAVFNLSKRAFAVTSGSHCRGDGRACRAWRRQPSGANVSVAAAGARCCCWLQSGRCSVGLF